MYSRDLPLKSPPAPALRSSARSLSTTTAILSQPPFFFHVGLLRISTALKMDSQSLNEDPESPSDSGALHGEPFTPPLSSAYEPITAYELTLN